MKDFSFLDAKQAVAEKHNFTDWEGFTDEGYTEYYAESADLYMRHAVNEAVRKDRGILADKYGIQRMKDLPPPFPEEAL